MDTRKHQLVKKYISNNSVIPLTLLKSVLFECSLNGRYNWRIKKALQTQYLNNNNVNNVNGSKQFLHSFIKLKDCVMQDLV